MVASDGGRSRVPGKRMPSVGGRIAAAARPVLEIDGSQHAGSGSIVRQAIALAALTGQPTRVVNARLRRPHPGLRRQHVTVLEAIRELVGGSLEGASVGSQTVSFRPGATAPSGRYVFDIGSAGSATMLALAVLPILLDRSRGVEIEVHGGLFQDFAPSLFHLQHVLLHLLAGMGHSAEIEMIRPGYVPAGQGIARLVVRAAKARPRPVALARAGPVESLWGIALASHLRDRQVAARISGSATAVLRASGMDATIDVREDVSAVQPGAAFALFADLAGRARLGADRAGAPRRSAEAMGTYVARRLLEDLRTGATVDRHAGDQLLLFAALVPGESIYEVPVATDHLRTAAWLSELFLGAEVAIDGRSVTVRGRA